MKNMSPTATALLIDVFLMGFWQQLSSVGTEEYNVSDFGYTNNNCKQDHFIVSFGLFMGFVDNMTDKWSPTRDAEMNWKNIHYESKSQTNPTKISQIFREKSLKSIGYLSFSQHIPEYRK